MMKKRPYENPGKLFIDKYGLPHDIDDILKYTDFLYQQSKLNDQPPIDLTKIFNHFGISNHQGALNEQQGLSDGNLGFTLVKEDDPITRQRFSEAHELIEFLFHEYKNLPEWERSYYSTHHSTKEMLCQKGASALLMPRSSFAPHVLNMGVSLQSASILAKLYETSLLATLYRMLDVCVGEYLLVIWKYTLRPSQENSCSQPSLFGDAISFLPEKKLRIWWVVKSSTESKNYIPSNQSVNKDSVIVRAFETGELQQAEEFFQMRGISGKYEIEAKRVNIGDELCILSLFHRASET